MKPLDRWAVSAGYSDFDTFIRAGGSIAEVAKDIARRIGELQNALKALAMDDPDEREPHTIVRPPVIDPDTLAQLEAEDEAADPENAHVQGADG
jgi:hypothetical protein